MARSGDVVENPITGERVRFLRTAAETKGRLLELELVVRPRGFVAAEHLHPRQEKRFIVRSGRMRLRVAGVERVVGPGENAVVPWGTAHAWCNDGDEELHARVEFRPALKTEALLETCFGLARDGRTNSRGVPGLLHLVLLAREFDDEIQLVRPPRAVQRMLVGLFAPVARLLGYRSGYSANRILPTY